MKTNTRTSRNSSYAVYTFDDKGRWQRHSTHTDPTRADIRARILSRSGRYGRVEIKRIDPAAPRVRKNIFAMMIKLFVPSRHDRSAASTSR